MTVKLRTFPAADVNKLEAKINEILSKPDAAGFEVAALTQIQTSTGQTLLLVFQKP